MSVSLRIAFQLEDTKYKFYSFAKKKKKTHTHTKVAAGDLIHL